MTGNRAASRNRADRTLRSRCRFWVLGAHVLVQIGYRDLQVRVVVSNGPAPQGAGSELSATGSGVGLAGLRQRVELMHGTLRAGPTPDGGFRVEAVLPAYVPTAEPTEHTERAAEQPAPAARLA